MRFTSTLVAISLILFSSFAFAESVNDLKKNIVLDQGKLAVMENLLLSDEESEKFWPVFRQFQENLYNLDKKHFELISSYLQQNKDKSLTDEQAKNMIDVYFTLLENRRRLLNDFAFVLDVEKVLPVKKIFRYLQIQQNIDAVEQYEISKKVPLLE
ncbi:hypothetical protein [Desulfuromonas sp. TF]|uniref:hypothetical protein n=1 Tax=Desulfuromonas sp. TF TaxID=1232410 RepID=UPI000485B480|nr:hypothetical protein [Desulfuromonas sp. TF]